MIERATVRRLVGGVHVEVPRRGVTLGPAVVAWLPRPLELEDKVLVGYLENDQDRPVVLALEPHLVGRVLTARWTVA